MKIRQNTSNCLFYTVAAILICSLSASVWFTTSSPKNDIKEYVYKIHPVAQPIMINSEWDKKIWNETEAVRLTNYLDKKPAHFPDTQVKVRYDQNNIYVIFHVKDQYVRALAKENKGRVWEDSCVEFFFTPGPDIERGYFNMETNCKGIILLMHSKKDSKERESVSPEDYSKIEIVPSLKQNVEVEITEPLTWTLEYKIPFSVLEKYMQVDKPGKGIQWRANFYKCGDKTSHPHWLTWAPISQPETSFHVPQYFGWLEFQ